MAKVTSPLLETLGRALCSYGVFMPRRDDPVKTNMDAEWSAKRAGSFVGKEKETVSCSIA
jgi:hypothetical protein